MNNIKTENMKLFMIYWDHTYQGGPLCALENISHFDEDLGYEKKDIDKVKSMKVDQIIVIDDDHIKIVRVQ